ncbi:Lrp/AsnC family transcriptional regulator [Subsaximicrobium wynnwilliamsii]|jgi:Lrp/AsnC family leucine-responsive transcriptional regulator|uniref:Lrp/AsnC family transcriptional regulator n=1 Tax=Subsaximicrobium wynnwilliamsii TaxID=291179 RepID=A0A5C6ZBV8_9FLAO|nr:Lrp/AsnC family transcriptional regulator [Subsaximicrobium wynnwilliamsii]TXD81840.1 Lrp/AsnC family transcriptional regulator [Subsaximicrobium wynnwilliamsii]TXD87509.1 Lrp/AsnC family transcriptional regulator [Subsaximicrobium wynnwilliamsii]TXE01192.1 Lrp/AsnC family transcriptional regulator [Subsaximicrobium wynnwilliamsii]
MHIDNLNWKILKCLQLNARQSNTEIGRTVGISSPAVSERIKKMEEAGVIQNYNTLVSPFEVGYQLKALITLRAFMGMLKPFLEKVKTYDEVINCYRITGNENIVMEVVLKNQKHLEAFIDQLIVYGETKTQIVLSHVIKHNEVKPLK